MFLIKANVSGEVHECGCFDSLDFSLMVKRNVLMEKMTSWLTVTGLKCTDSFLTFPSFVVFLPYCILCESH